MINKLGLVSCVKDSCIYMKRSRNNNIILIGLFVDDIMGSYSNVDAKEWIEYKNILKGQYDVSDLGDVHHILGMRVQYNGHKLILDQQVYIEDKLKLFGLDECKGYSTPEDSIKLIKSSSNNANHNMNKIVNEYRAKVGSLAYASLSTR